MMETPVIVGSAITRDVPVYIEEIGTCAAREVVSVKPQVSGIVTQLHFEDGTDIKKGQLLFTIDPRPLQAALDQAKASQAQAKANLILAQQEFERVKGLVGTRAVSREDYETRENAVTVAKAQVQAGDAAVETAQVNYDYCFIKSPIDGRAGQRLVDPGNVINTQNPPTMLVIQRLDPVYADFTIPEQNLAEVRRNMADHTLRTLVRTPDDPDAAPHEGELTFLDNSVQDGSGTVKLRATIANADRRLWPGQFVRVQLVLRTVKNAVLVPSQATQISQQGPYVWVVKNDDTAELRPVTLGQQQGELVVVETGVRPGERIVTSGQLGIAPGAKVHVQQAAAPEGTPPAATQPTQTAGGE
jgi:multidrug efflux system membrane fusion protein